jgi:hypothetical protein
MKKIVTLSLVAVATLGLAACNKTATDTTVVNETDTSATTNEATTDLNAATDELGNTGGAMVAQNVTETSNTETATTNAQ